MVWTGVVQIVGVEANVVRGQTLQMDTVWMKSSGPNPGKMGEQGQNLIVRFDDEVGCTQLDVGLVGGWMG